MESNLLLEQFGKYKRLELESSPFHFLLDANIELNPHQINAFCAAVQALKTGGIVLADEVGLGNIHLFHGAARLFFQRIHHVGQARLCISELCGGGGQAAFFNRKQQSMYLFAVHGD